MTSGADLPWRMVFLRADLWMLLGGRGRLMREWGECRRAAFLPGLDGKGWTARGEAATGRFHRMATFRPGERWRMQARFTGLVVKLPRTYSELSVFASCDTINGTELQSGGDKQIGQISGERRHWD
jgi:hypothetical protein